MLSVAVAAGVGARPDEAEGLLAAFDQRVVEEVGVDRLGEARVVELEAQVVAALGRALGPGGADLGTADEDAVGGGVVVRGAVLGDDADGFRLDAEGDDFADIFAAGLLEGSDGGHVISPFGLSEPAPFAASMAIVRTGAIRRRSPCGPKRERRTARPVFLAARGMASARGRKSGPAVAAKVVEASADPGQISR